LGERFILIPLLRQTGLPELFGDDTFTKSTLRFAWHLTTIAWWGLAALLILYATTSSPELADSTLRIIGLTFLASSGLALVGSRGRHLSWIVFLAIAVAAWIGANQMP
jgi:hypothetical protein